MNHWKDLDSELNEDIWGLGYKIATKCNKQNNLPFNMTAKNKRNIA